MAPPAPPVPLALLVVLAPPAPLVPLEVELAVDPPVPPLVLDAVVSHPPSCSQGGAMRLPLLVSLQPM
jgi:hypothetical protein